MPNNPASNLSDHAIITATRVFAIVSTITFGLRAWARLLTRAWGVDDWLMLPAWCVLHMLLDSLLTGQGSLLGPMHRDSIYARGATPCVL